MNKQDYEKAKAEYWDAFNREHPHSGIITEKAFLYAFDRAYTLGKQDKDAEGEEMLSIERILIQSYYNAHKNSRDILYDLFGSKCLRDEPASESASEPKSETDKHFDNILKDSFRNERRLNIAVQLVCAMIPKFKDNGDGHGLSVLNEKYMIKCAYRLVDYLISECEEGGKS